jgi:hypothetical protein
MRGKAKKNWTAVSHELILTAVSLDSSSQGGLCTSRSSKELGLIRRLQHYTIGSQCSTGRHSSCISTKSITRDKSQDAGGEAVKFLQNRSVL